MQRVRKDKDFQFKFEKRKRILWAVCKLSHTLRCFDFGICKSRNEKLQKAETMSFKKQKRKASSGGEN
jgi:hypothetical protein